MDETLPNDPHAHLWAEYERLTKNHLQVATVEDIFNCFRLILGRNPNPEEWIGHTSRCGEDLASVVGSYLSSLEFVRRDLLRPDEGDQPVLTAYDDFKIYTRPGDLSVGRYIAHHDYEREIQAVFRSHLKPGMAVLDIGANVGFFTMLSAAMVGREGRVIAVEPNADNVKLLEASRRENGFEQVQICCFAASATPGILALNTSHSNGTTARPGYSLNQLFSSSIVPALDLDRITSELRVDFVKIDVEGAEYLALQGLNKTLTRCRPIIVSEFTPNSMQWLSGVSSGDYLRFLQGLGYSISVIEPDGSATQCHDEAQVMTMFQRRRTDHVDLLMMPE